MFQEVIERKDEREREQEIIESTETVLSSIITVLTNAFVNKNS